MVRSEDVVIQSPTSYTGSARRIWKLTAAGDGFLKVVLVITAVLFVGIAWCFVTVWYLIWGILLVPWRLIRRGARKRKRDELRHRELLEVLAPDAKKPGSSF